MEKDNKDKKDKSNKNVFSKIFKKKKKEDKGKDKNHENVEIKPKIRSLYYAALTGMPDSALSYVCSRIYVDIHNLERRELYSENLDNKLLALPDVTLPQKIECSGNNFVEVLPLEISLKIFSVVDPTDWLSLTLVNKKWSAVLQDPKTWQTFNRREDLASFQSISECFRASLAPLCFMCPYENMNRTVRYDVRNDARYWRDRTDSIDYDIIIVTVNLGKFDIQKGEDKSTNYLRRSSDYLAEIARVKLGQTQFRRPIVVVCTGGGDLRTKIDEKGVSFQQYFPEATKVIQGSVLDIIDFMESFYKARLSDQTLYGDIELHVLELESFTEYRRENKVSEKINKIVLRHLARERNRLEQTN